MPDIRVLVAEPIYLGMSPAVYFNRIAFWKSIFEGDNRPDRTYSVKPLVMGPRESIRNARDKAIKIATNYNATHILFIDDDVKVPENILESMLSIDKDVVGGLMKSDNGKPIVFRATQSGSEGVWLDHPKDTPFECAAVGAGCMLIKMSAIYRLLNSEYRPQHWLFNYDPSDRSMDVLFCRMIVNSGGSIWCLPEPACEQVQHY